MPDYSRVPADLAELEQWVTWRRITRADRETKLLCQASGPRAGKSADSTDPQTWTSFEVAVAAAESPKFAGIGFVFSDADPYTGIDLDRCLDDSGALKAWARPIVERLADSYMEISPSGRGVKIWIRARIPGASGKKIEHLRRDAPGVAEALGDPDADGGIEMYDHARFFTITGNVYKDAPSQIEEHQDALDWLYGLITGGIAGKPGSGGNRVTNKADLHSTASVPAGQRHNFLMSLAAQYRVRGMEHAEILAALQSINQTRCVPPKPANELLGIVDWVCQRPAGKSDGTLPRDAQPTAEPQPIRSSPVPESSRQNWRDGLILNANGAIKPIFFNACLAIREAPDVAGALAYNEFSGHVETRAPMLSIAMRTEWTDHEDRILTEWLHSQGILVAISTTADAVALVARETSYHPVREYLDGLVWDGNDRCGQWLSLYLGAPNTDYTQAVGARWLMSAVARIFRPGCKADCALILEGEQGIRKSTALKVLGEPWFTDEIADLGSKDAAMQMQGAWIIEIAELDSMSKSDVGRVKAFMSRGTDRFRPPYGKHVITSLRQCIFAGSVNHATYLRDETGGRRFWPIPCGTIRIDDLARDRKQMWAEAVARYRTGATWWLEDRALQALAEVEQRERYEGDPWDVLIERWIEDPKPAQGCSLADLESTAQAVTVTDILYHCLGKRMDTWTQADKVRVARILKAAGWERFKDRDGSDRSWKYRNTRAVGG